VEAGLTIPWPEVDLHGNPRLQGPRRDIRTFERVCGKALLSWWRARGRPVQRVWEVPTRRSADLASLGCLRAQESALPACLAWSWDLAAGWLEQLLPVLGETGSRGACS
jgi:hypothetical protein